ncbi:MAG: hypothetical protein D6724_07495 [Armatimonadetes bacterium]|nr:MAG: hypothetical protein D6724_07495 [Armatimonadota bacterium]
MHSTAVSNAVAESVFATLEKELLSCAPLASRAQTRAAIADHIENYYDVRRRHSYLDYAAPLEYELRARSTYTCPSNRGNSSTIVRGSWISTAPALLLPSA